MEMQRREFLKTTATAAACACLGCACLANGAEKLMASPLPPDSYRIEGKKLILDISKVPKLQDVGGFASTEAAGRKVIILHTGDQQFKAFQNKCTHMGGTFTYKYQEGFMQCTVHGSRFDLNGQVVRGPAKLPIPEFKTSVDKNEVTVELP